MKIKYNSCKVKQNKFGSCTFFLTTFLEIAVYPVHNFRPHVAVKVKFTAPLLLACIFFLSLSLFFFSLMIYLFSLYTNRLQILQTHCFQFLLSLSIALIREIENHVFAGKKCVEINVACHDVKKPSI